MARPHWGEFMTENQHTEWKESWRDEHMKHVCAFSNAQGGTLFVGIADNGAVIGVKDAKKLLEDIPNKAVQLLGVTVSARVRREEGRDVIEIGVPLSSVPISLHGRFYIRSGSTSQELRGHELRDFILRKDNITWDEITVTGATLDDLDQTAIVRFAPKRPWLTACPMMQRKTTRSPSFASSTCWGKATS